MLNVICIMGRLAHEPVAKTTPNGVPVTTFTVAVERSMAGQDGNRQTDFFDVVAWRKTAEFVSRYFNKGSWIAVNGSLQTRSYEDKNGNKRKAYEIIADNVHFAGNKSDASTGGDADDSQFIQQAQAAPTAQASGFEVVTTDDLPF
jgi:single-strand DNA-binding protein